MVSKKVILKHFLFWLKLDTYSCKIRKIVQKFFSIYNLDLSKAPVAKSVKYLQNAIVEFFQNLYLETTIPKQHTNYHLRNVPFFDGLTPYLTGLFSLKLSILDTVFRQIEQT